MHKDVFRPWLCPRPDSGSLPWTLDSWYPELDSRSSLEWSWTPFGKVRLRAWT